MSRPSSNSQCFPCDLVQDRGERVVLERASRSLGAVCLDGSPPQYYISTGLEPKKWMIYHEVLTTEVFDRAWHCAAPCCAGLFLSQ